MKIYLLCRETNWQSATKKEVVSAAFFEKQLIKKLNKLDGGGTLAHTVYYTQGLDCTLLAGLGLIMGKRQ